jgi:outer membrane biosynthesis protein TonB
LNRSTAAFLIAFLFHLLLLLILLFVAENFKIIKNSTHQEKRLKISLKELPKSLKKEDIGIQKPLQKPEITQPMYNPLVEKPLQKYVPKPAEQQTQQVHQTNINKSENLPQKAPAIIQPTQQSTSYITAPKATDQTKTSVTPQVPKEHAKLYKFLSQEDKSSSTAQNTSQKTKKSSQVEQNVKELYGSKFAELSQGEQKYIQDNMEVMRQITQDTLNRVGRVNIPDNFRVNSTNVIEFYLHPNGDMTDFKFLQNSNYYILDDTTKETIEYAYSKYPRPAQKTLIRYKVYYNLRGN